MPRTEQSAAWSDKKRVPEPRPNTDASEAAELAVHYGPRCAALISDSLDVERAPRGPVPLSFLIPMSFTAPPEAARSALSFQR